MSNTKKTIHIIVKYFLPVNAGIEVNISNTYQQLIQNGYDVIVHTANKTYLESMTLPKSEKMLNFTIKRYKWTPFGFWPSISRSELKNSIVALHNFDIFPHFWWLIYTIFLRSVKKCDFKLFLTPHGGYNPEWSIFPIHSRIIKWFYTRTIGTLLINLAVDGVRAVSMWEKENMIRTGLNPKLIHVLDNGLENTAFLPIEEMASESIKSQVAAWGDYIVDVARIYPIKDMDVIIKSLQNIPSHVKFVIVGDVQDQTYLQNLKSLIKSLGLSDRVVFFGTVFGVDKYYIYLKSLLFVHMARWESYGNVIREAMSQAKVCIVANNTAQKLLIKNNFNGFTVTTGNAQELAIILNSTIKSIYNKSSHIMKIENTNMKIARENSWDQVGAKLANIYDNLLNKKDHENGSSNIQKLFDLKSCNLFSKFTKNIAKVIFGTLMLFVIIITLLATIKGDVDQNGKIMYQDIKSEQINLAGGPFEVSITAGRYALTRALAMRRSVLYDYDEAKFSSPDVIKTHLGFSSVFTPGIGFLAVPFYMIGDLWGLPQVGAFSLGTTFLLINFVLIYNISKKFLQKSSFLALLNAFIFAFGTNGIIYAQLLTQHQVTIFSMLIMVVTLLSTKRSSFQKSMIIGGVYIFSGIVDFPNFLMFLPFVLYSVLSHMKIEYTPSRININIKKSIFSLGILAIPLTLLFMYYNLLTTGNPLLLGQIVGNTNYFRVSQPSAYTNLPDNYEELRQNKKTSNLTLVNLPFKTRRMLTGFKTLFVSSERAWWYYSPIVFFGILGYFLYLKKSQNQEIVLLLGLVSLINILIYISFGDSWGGWAFGPRYLLPSTAIFSLFLTLPLLMDLRKIFRYIIRVLFLLLAFASISFNLLGATTTSAVPPYQEAINLISPIPWNIDLHYIWLQQNKSGSLIFNYFFKNNTSVNASMYYEFLLRLNTLTLILLLTFAFYPKKQLSSNEFKRS